MTRAVTRSLSVLELLAASPEPLDLPEIIERTGIARASAHRLMKHLADDGYVTREVAPPGFRISFRLWQIAASMLSSREVRDVALPGMIDLAGALQHPVMLSFLEGTDVCYTDRIDVIGDRVSPTLLSARLPAATCASGRVWLAWADEATVDAALMAIEAETARTITDPAASRNLLGVVREQGYATVDRENRPDGSGIAAPVFGRDGRVCGAVAVPIFGALSEEALRTILPALLQTTRRISLELGHRATARVMVA
ncbi:MAG: IclR family transcriptional regulator [Dehalococcoidia bacterium]